MPNSLGVRLNRFLLQILQCFGVDLYVCTVVQAYPTDDEKMVALPFTKGIFLFDVNKCRKIQTSKTKNALLKKSGFQNWKDFDENQLFNLALFNQDECEQNFQVLHCVFELENPHLQNQNDEYLSFPLLVKTNITPKSFQSKMKSINLFNERYQPSVLVVEGSHSVRLKKFRFTKTIVFVPTSLNWFLDFLFYDSS